MEVMMMCYLMKLDEMGYIKKSEFLSIENCFEIRKKTTLANQLRISTANLNLDTGKQVGLYMSIYDTYE